MADTFQPRYVRRPDIFFTVVDDELILMEENGERFFSSNGVAVTIWNALEAPVSVDALCEAVMARFTGAARATVEGDIADFIDKLGKRDLIRTVGG